MHDAPQRPRAVLLDGINAAAAHTHIGQHHIHQRQDRACQQPSQAGIAQAIALFTQPEAAQRGRNDQAEVQRRDGIHGLIALGKALQEGRGLIGRLRSGNLHLPTRQKADKQEHQQRQQAWRQHMADAANQLARRQA